MTRFTRCARWLSCAALVAVLGAACTPAASEPTTSPTSQPHATNAPPAGEMPPNPGPPPKGYTGPALTGDCNMSSWTWPVCDISWPSIPRYGGGGGRPDLTPKDSAWCRNNFIRASNSGYTYWMLTQNTKYDIRFWPDYYSRYYEAIYWDGRAWQWLPYDSDYPSAIMGQTVNCDA